MKLPRAWLTEGVAAASFSFGRRRPPITVVTFFFFALIEPIRCTGSCPRTVLTWQNPWLVQDNGAAALVHAAALRIMQLVSAARYIPSLNRVYRLGLYQ